ncbi:MAG: HesA/MoeB/ThiF family protein [Candidatus Pelagibacter sp.]
MNLKTNELERYSRQIIIKDIGISGQKKIKKSKVLIVGLGGLGCPVAEYLCRAGVGTIGLIDHDKIDLSNIHRQSMFTTKDINKYKVKVVSDRVKMINPNIRIKSFKKKLNRSNIEILINDFDIIIDGTDNFTSKFLVNEFSRKFKKIFVCGAISKFDGHVFSFNFSKDNSLCLKSFYQTIPNDEVLSCEADGVVGTIASVVGSIQANEVIKNIIGIGKSLNGKVLIINLLNLDFRISNLKRIK